MKSILLATAAALFATIATADGLVTYDTTESFDDVVFGLENAIVGQGLVIDSVNHVGEMLERTKGDVGSDVKLFEHADVYSFCSATLSRKVMEADRTNFQFCPYGVYVFQLPGEETVKIGYREYPVGPMQEVQALLDGIAREAIGLD